MGWIRRLFDRRRQEQEFDRELQFHIDQLTRDNLARGMTPDEAHRQAMVEFGGQAQCREALDDLHRIYFLETFVANLRFAFRMLRKRPGLSAAIVLTLALGTGAN